MVLKFEKIYTCDNTAHIEISFHSSIIAFLRVSKEVKQLKELDFRKCKLGRNGIITVICWNHGSMAKKPVAGIMNNDVSLQANRADLGSLL